jgi:hypothetical protein
VRKRTRKDCGIGPDKRLQNKEHHLLQTDPGVALRKDAMQFYP